MDKEALLAKLAIPTGTSNLGGVDVNIRGMSGGEEVEFADDLGYTGNILKICQVCIINDDGEPVFTLEEVTKMRAGIFSPVLLDILKLSFPEGKKTRKKS